MQEVDIPSHVFASLKNILRLTQGTVVLRIRPDSLLRNNEAYLDVVYSPHNCRAVAGGGALNNCRAVAGGGALNNCSGVAGGGALQTKEVDRYPYNYATVRACQQTTLLPNVRALPSSSESILSSSEEDSKTIYAPANCSAVSNSSTVPSPYKDAPESQSLCKSVNAPGNHSTVTKNSEGPTQTESLQNVLADARSYAGNISSMRISFQENGVEVDDTFMVSRIVWSG